MSFNENLKIIKTAFDKAISSLDSEALMRFSSTLGDFDKALQEHVQEMTRVDIQRVIAKLERNEVLTSQYLELVRLWIVGDAEHYTRLENNFDSWVAELTRLMNEISALKDREVDIKNSMHIRALIYDATRVTDDLIYFTQHQERIARFVDSTEELTSEENAILIGILKNKLKSEIF